MTDFTLQLILGCIVGALVGFYIAALAAIRRINRRLHKLEKWVNTHFDIWEDWSK